MAFNANRRGMQVVSPTMGGMFTTPVAAGTVANTVISNVPGKICRILVTTVGTNGLQIFDNASTNSGTIIAALAASAPIGIYDFQLPAALGITLAGNAANPAVTIGWE